MTLLQIFLATFFIAALGGFIISLVKGFRLIIINKRLEKSPVK